ncbi:hypothetical protein FNV43_RR12789 [Rhamnella rubrinervis]|uniref:Uncharacterized protein n=1 Tax=Rhamnella rubrinervis TaxID=2594499 RepID=A0A8K0H7Z2_9ROSA|nr:hypothetical protein FNV43_RR12789 [Rhamnella rubrinervis]
MEALKSHVKVLNSKSITLFLSQVSSTTKLKTAHLSALLRISLCEFVVLVHRLKIVPFINTIITTIINTLAMASSATEGSFLVQLACFKVVRVIVRYGIDPTTPPVNKMRIIKSLCDSLCHSLSGFSSLKVPSNIDCLGSGAALCLRAVVDSDHWRIASEDMVTMVCIYVDAALRRRPNQTNAYMSLIMALAKFNVDSNILRKTPRMLVRSPSQRMEAYVVGDDEFVSSTNDLPGHSNVRVCSPKVVDEGIIEMLRSFIASKFGFDPLKCLLL